MRLEAAELGRRLLERAGIAVGGDRPWDITVHDDRFWDRAVAQRELGLGESYMDGWWDVPELDQFVARILEADIQSALRPTPQLILHVVRSSVINRQTLPRARRNAQHHYDIGNDLFERMLDKRMVYSCGYWRDANDLDTAQQAKLDLICRKLSIEPGMTVLDIGCGWGGFAQYAAEHYGARVTGISPALAQVAEARSRCRDLDVEIIDADYRTVTGRYDRIVSIGMMEHVGARHLEEFFRHCDGLLAEDGMMLHHVIGSNRSKKHTDPWFDRYIFPGGVIPSLAQVAHATEGSWAIEDVHNFGPDYDRTLLAWHRNVEAAWPDLGKRYDERFQRMWRYYLLTSAAAFRVRNLQLYQHVIRRAERSTTYRGVR